MMPSLLIHLFVHPLGKLGPHKFFKASGRTIKYAFVCYGILQGLAGGLSLLGPDSLFSTHFYKPVILGNLGNVLLAFPTLAGLWLLNHLMGQFIHHMKAVLQMLFTLAIVLGIALVFWWLFVKPVGV